MINKQIKKPKVIVIGLDGGTWNIIKPLLKQGKLPTIEKLMENGTHGDLETIIPPGTWTGWRSFTTGKNPGKYGVFDWYTVDMKNQEVGVIDSNSYKSKELWDYLGENGFNSGIINMPTTYPPKKINGFMVSCVLMNTRDYTYPKEIEKHLKKEFKYKLTPDYTFKENKTLAIKACEELIIQRFEVSKYLLRKYQPDFFNPCLFYTDHIQHYYWKDMVNNDPEYGKVIENLWILIDNELKKLINEFADEETYIVMMSDHGFNKLKYTFSLGKWCVKNKYLILNKKFNLKIRLSKLLNKLKINIDNLAVLLIKLRLYQIIKRIIPLNYQFKIMGLLPNKDSRINITFTSNKIINFKKSKIILVGGRIYINKKFVKEEYGGLLEKLTTELEEIKNPFNKVPLFKKIYKKEEIYVGEYLKYAPDLIPLDNMLNISSSSDFSGNPDKFWSKNPEWSGMHDLNGIFCISGPGIRKNKEIKNARIIDLAPTILHLFNIPIPDDIDGRVLTECFEENSELAKREIIFQDVNKIDKLKDKVKKLKKLGKI